jgi:hypothetical protein
MKSGVSSASLHLGRRISIRAFDSRIFCLLIYGNACLTGKFNLCLLVYLPWSPPSLNMYSTGNNDSFVQYFVTRDRRDANISASTARKQKSAMNNYGKALVSSIYLTKIAPTHVFRLEITSRGSGGRFRHPPAARAYRLRRV